VFILFCYLLIMCHFMDFILSFITIFTVQPFCSVFSCVECHYITSQTVSRFLAYAYIIVCHSVLCPPCVIMFSVHCVPFCFMFIVCQSIFCSSCSILFSVYHVSFCLVFIVCHSVKCSQFDILYIIHSVLFCKVFIMCHSV
jgi:hypothetical protein